MSVVPSISGFSPTSPMAAEPTFATAKPAPTQAMAVAAAAAMKPRPAPMETSFATAAASSAATEVPEKSASSAPVSTSSDETASAVVYIFLPFSIRLFLRTSPATTRAATVPPLNISPNIEMHLLLEFFVFYKFCRAGRTPRGCYDFNAPISLRRSSWNICRGRASSLRA